MAEQLNQIETVWTMVHGSYAEDPSVARSSRAEFLERYGPAAKRYLLGAVRDVEAADELYQEFALRYLRGDLRAADPDRGKFRSYLKSILYRMVADHFRRRRRDAMRSFELLEPSAVQQDYEDPNDSRRRSDLLAQSIEMLEATDNSEDKAYSTAFRLRLHHPNLRSMGFAEALSERLGRVVTASHARVMVHRAREQFANILLVTIADSMDNPTRTRLEEELMSLRLLPYCVCALKKYCA
jgi:RNA polymerase sigma factor (sigma-70 family)